ncbi:metal ABC transporter substrate-binding protein [Micromonospora luteifusca]|uniref:metal ABC transporter substrate-binding protein n=1 Tax=Micromonospora luteifusca TaxID=709860 RepID=UPI00339F37E0
MVATTPEVADFVRTIGGSDVTVTQIIKPNVDPHDYEPTPVDIQAIGKAAIVVRNGVGLERWLDQTIGSAGFKGTVVDSSQGVTLRGAATRRAKKATRRARASTRPRSTIHTSGTTL